MGEPQEVAAADAEQPAGAGTATCEVERIIDEVFGAIGEDAKAKAT